MRRITDNFIEASLGPCKEHECILRGALFSPNPGEGACTQICRLPGMVKRRSYQPKDVLFHESSPASVLFLLTSGFVKLTTALPDGRSQVLRLGTASQLLGIEALLDQKYPYRAEAATEVNVCMIPYRDLLRVLGQNPDVALRFIDALNRELQRSNDMIRNLGLMSSTERVASFLLGMAPRECRPDQNIVLPLSRKEMAEMLGVTLETVSRIIAKLVRDRIIHAPRFGGQFRILNLDRLIAISGTRTESLTSTEKPDLSGCRILPLG